MGEETRDQRIARLQRELADAKVQALQAELALAQGSPSAVPAAPPPTSFPWLTKPAPPDVGVLAPAPRSVPARFKALAVPWSWWTMWALFMISIAPIALWMVVPVALAIAAGAAFVVILALRVRGERKQLALLKWGEVATVTNVDVASVGTYYSGTTYQNVRMAQAHGWQVTHSWYSGPATTTKITYELNGTSATLTLHGLAYDNGVILADKRKPSRALCVSSFAYDLDRDAAGNWAGHVPRRVVIGSAFMVAVLVAWTAGMILIGLAA